MLSASCVGFSSTVAIAYGGLVPRRNMAAEDPDNPWKRSGDVRVLTPMMEGQISEAAVPTTVMIDAASAN